MNDLWTLTDRTFDKMSNQLGEYSDQLKDQFEEQAVPWFRQRWHDRRDKRCNSHDQWAFPVPTARQYDRCKEKNGLSLWNRDGSWRCVLPDDEKYSEVQSQLSQRQPLENREWFSDYSVFLDWRRAMIKAEQAKREQLLQQQQREQLTTKDKWSSDKWYKDGWLADTSDKVKYVSESDAQAQGKKVVSKSVVMEMVSQDDGTVKTNKVVKKWYDDGTMSKSEIVDEGRKPGGWFWK